MAASVLSAGAARQRALVTGRELCALSGDAPEEPGPPEPQDCDSPVPCATSGIPGLCQLCHPISSSSVLAAGMGTGHPTVSSDQLRAPRSQTSPGDVRVWPGAGLPWQLPWGRWQQDSQLPWGWWHVLHHALPARCGAAAAGSCSSASRLAGVFIEQIAPSCFYCKASTSESKDLPSTSRMAPQLSVILSSPALPRGCHASLLPCAHPCFLSHWSSFPYLGVERKCCTLLL